MLEHLKIDICLLKLKIDSEILNLYNWKNQKIDDIAI